MQFRNSIGQFASSYWKSLSWQQKVCLFIMFLCAATPAAGKLHETYTKLSKEIVYIAAPRAEADELVKDKTALELRNEMMDRLHKGEGAGHSVKIGSLFLTFDPPKSLYEKCIRIGGVAPMECFSIGEYQMKTSFIQHFHPLMYGGGISEENAILLANDPRKARAFAEKCIIEVEGCVWHWSAAKAQAEYFEMVVPIIRKLEK